MNDKTQDPSILKWLFATDALRVSPAAKPFWYASGQFGPYFINTHFLSGSEKEAGKLLSAIESALKQPQEELGNLADAFGQQAQGSLIFAGVLDRLQDACQSLPFDLISGGERRDLFFSLPLAKRLGVPHVTILKNGQTYLTRPDCEKSQSLEGQELDGQTVLHVADLVTEASSYVRAWLPALHALKLQISDTLVVIDRDQGGKDVLAQEKVMLHALTTIERGFFEKACRQGLIDAAQKSQIERFAADPKAYMRSFLSDHPDFIQDELEKGGKTKQRALLFLEQFGDEVMHG